MGQLHELLAVDRDLASAAKMVVDEATNTFTKKTDHFLGNVKRLELFDESRKQEESGFAEEKTLTTTVGKKLEYVAESLVRYIDVLAQKERTNQEAKANIELEDGTVFLTDVPATMLLSLENHLERWRLMYHSIPTLQPGIEWIPDPDQGEGVYKSVAPEIRNKTEKVIRHKVLYDATDKHPAQIEKWTEDAPIGRFINVRWSGMISPAEKSKLLGRIDSLIAAVKKARMRANTQEVVKVSIGKKIFDFVNKGV
jgi:hypothetical protein